MGQTLTRCFNDITDLIDEAEDQLQKEKYMALLEEVLMYCQDKIGGENVQL